MGPGWSFSDSKDTFAWKDEEFNIDRVRQLCYAGFVEGHDARGDRKDRLSVHTDERRPDELVAAEVEAALF